MPSKQTVVWGGWLFLPGDGLGTPSGQVRVVVRVRSRAAAVRALKQIDPRMSDTFVRDYWSETGNADELRITEGTEGVLFATNAMRCDGRKFEYQRIVPGGGDV